MSSTSRTFDLPLPPRAASRTDGWRARAIEFLLVGGVTLFLFPLAWLLRRGLGLDASDYAFGFATFYGAYVINDPHFAVTYLLFYRRAKARILDRDLALAQRVRYLVSGVVVPVLLVGWGVAALALRSAQAVGWMVQLMFLLVGWHYAKQGFGVLTVLSARRGVRVTPRERTVILFHCFAAWGYAWANPASAAGEFEEKGVVYWAPAHPRWLELVLGGVLALSVIALLIVLIARWRREGRTLPAAPLSGFLITIWSWTIYTRLDPLVQYAIPALHSVQYLYFVWLLKSHEARDEEGPPRFGRPVAARLGALAVSALALGWLFFHGAPAALDGIFVARPRRGADPGPLGATPFFATIFVIVNIHHYFMDHVIWRRENPDTRYLQPLPALAAQSIGWIGPSAGSSSGAAAAPEEAPE
jgi:hypothetical protein